MADLSGSKDHLLASDLEPEELESILDRIDDYLALWQVIYHKPAPLPEEIPLPSPAQLGAASDWLRMSSAPLYPSMGIGGAHGILLRFLNLFVKIFGSVQIKFNRKLREFLADLMPILYEYERQTDALKSKVNELNSKIQTLEAANRSHQKEINLLSDQLSALREELDKTMNDHKDPDHSQWK